MTWARMRVVVFCVVSVVLIAVGVGYTKYAVDRDNRRAHAADAGGVKGEIDLGPAPQPRLLFRTAVPGAEFGRLGTADLGNAEATRVRGDKSCARVYEAGGTVLCLVTETGLIARHFAVVMDADLREKKRYEIAGLPNRARVSASGRMASWTVFTYGDDYAGMSFGTRTGIADTTTGRMVDSLENFATYKDGSRFDPVDRNFWGVTFTADDNIFYATMSPITTGKTYLVRGNFAEGRMDVLRENVECPSLSPDGTRLVFKKKVSADTQDPWRTYVLDLRTMQESPVAETRSVDDQVAWLDDRTLAYALRTPGHGAGWEDIWQVPADGSGAPTLLVSGASSPAVLPAGP